MFIINYRIDIYIVDNFLDSIDRIPSSFILIYPSRWAISLLANEIHEQGISFSLIHGIIINRIPPSFN